MHHALTMHLDPHPSSVGTARNVAREFVAPWVSDTLRADAALLVSEVVTNAVLHAGSRVRMELTQIEQVLRVEIFDASFDMPVLTAPDSATSSGRGMHLVDALSTRWGTWPRADGKAVWFELEEDCGPQRPPE